MSDPEKDVSLHEAPTTSDGARSPSPSPDTSPGSAGRYQVAFRLGAGGMGEVFKAYDPDLGRCVALKFLRGDDPDLLARFQQEARAQARLDHEHICKVYEVGEAAGRRFIAMQYVDGLTLRDAARQMTLEQKVAVVRDVAEAVHAAHKLGLIHRDLKPGNVMVERREDGGWHGYVMDFGIVRDQSTPGMTVTGVVVGTPGFMAPEQLQGKLGSLDRRADVYGLGATLYALFTGRAPFGDDATVDVMLKVLETDPPAPSRVNGDIPPDLDTVVMKCLEKEPNRRYDSAKALADDLQRYLDGEPIQARRSSLAYRVLKKARKNRGLVAVLAGASAALLLLGSVSLRARWAAAHREELARRFGQEIKEIESLMRIAHLLPLHDTRMERALVRSKMAAIEKMPLGDAGRGPAAYALGKGHLVLGEYAAARQDLEAAWKSGYRRPEVAYALGQVMGTLYRMELQDAARLGSEELVAARKSEIAQEYRAPALEYLKQSRGVDLEAPEYAEALLALYEQRHDEALARARSVSARAPWLYEARQLEGDVYAAQGDGHSEQGRYEAARDAYAKAEAAYQSAREIGRSDSRIPEGIANLDLTRMEMEIYGPDKDVETHFEKGLAACESALKADPESPDALRLRADLYHRMAEYERDHGEDPRPRLQKSIEAARQSVALRATVQGYASLEEVFRIQAAYELDRGIDPSASVRSAHDAYRHAVRLNPRDPDVHNSMGIAFRALAGYEARNGKDPRANLRKAIDAYLEAIRRNPRYSYPYNNAGNAYAERAAYELDHGMDPRQSVDEARRACAKAAELNPSFPYPHNNVATAYNTRARYEIQHGLDPRASLQVAIESGHKAAQVKATFAPAYGNIARAYQVQAEYDWLQGLDPRRSVERSLRAGSKALELNPTMPVVLGFVASSHFVLAGHELDQGRDPRGSFARSRQAARKALAANPRFFEGHLVAGLVALLEARWRMGLGQEPAESFALSRKALEAATAIRADDARARIALAELSFWQARWLRRNGRPADGELEAGLGRTREALSLDPSLAEAMALQGLLLQAQSQTRSGAQRQTLADQARTLLQEALAANRNLSRRYAGSL